MTGRLKILYVDDERDIRTIVEMALALDPDLELEIAESGAQALTLLADGFSPDIALLDLMMPEMSGLELLARLRLMPEFASLPVLFITASARQSDVERHMRAGADGVIIKPFDPLTLARTVRDHHERIAAERSR